MSDEADLIRRRALQSLTLPSLLLPLLGAGIAATPAAALEGEESRTLVAFLSRSGNTRVIAGQLQRRFDADLFEIRTAEPYPADYEETVARAQRERDAAATPALAERVAGIGRYETVFLGFVPPRDLETPDCDYAASGIMSIWSRRNWAGERCPWRSISQHSL